MGKILRTQKLTTFSELIIVIAGIGAILEGFITYLPELRQLFQNS